MDESMDTNCVDLPNPYDELGKQIAELEEEEVRKRRKLNEDDEQEQEYLNYPTVEETYSEEEYYHQEDYEQSEDRNAHYISVNIRDPRYLEPTDEDEHINWLFDNYDKPCFPIDNPPFPWPIESQPFAPECLSDDVWYIICNQISTFDCRNLARVCRYLRSFIWERCSFTEENKIAFMWVATQSCTYSDFIFLKRFPGEFFGRIAGYNYHELLRLAVRFDDANFLKKMLAFECLSVDALATWAERCKYAFEYAIRWRCPKCFNMVINNCWIPSSSLDHLASLISYHVSDSKYINSTRWKFDLILFRGGYLWRRLKRRILNALMYHNNGYLVDRILHCSPEYKICYENCVELRREYDEDDDKFSEVYSL